MGMGPAEPRAHGPLQRSNKGGGGAEQRHERSGLAAWRPHLENVLRLQLRRTLPSLTHNQVELDPTDLALFATPPWARDTKMSSAERSSDAALRPNARAPSAQVIEGTVSKDIHRWGDTLTHAELLLDEADRRCASLDLCPSSWPARTLPLRAHKALAPCGRH